MIYRMDPHDTSRGNGLQNYMDVLVHHIPGQNIISLARNKAEADNNVKDYNGIKLLYLIGAMTDMTNKLEEINKQ